LVNRRLRIPNDLLIFDGNGRGEIALNAALEMRQSSAKAADDITVKSRRNAASPVSSNSLRGDTRVECCDVHGGMVR